MQEKLTEAEKELFYCLMEECGEVIHVCAKILRHGPMKNNPDILISPNNLEEFHIEVSDILIVLDIMKKNKMFNETKAIQYFEKRKSRKKQYMHFQENHAP